MMKTLRDFTLFLLDMDGTIYLGNHLFPETPGFLKAIRDRGARYLFLTNNSSRDKKAYAEKLNRLGIRAGEDDVFSSGDATAIVLREKGYRRLFRLFFFLALVLGLALRLLWCKRLDLLDQLLCSNFFARFFLFWSSS